MNNSSQPSFYLIGGDTLLTECGRQLIDGGFRPIGVISRNPAIAAWADSTGIPFLSLDDDYLSAMESAPADYLFAITHLEMLPDRALAAARLRCINFHDGPLPRYAGLNAPAWALVNGETGYGITWHEIVAGVDKGDILLQESFPIAPDETSLSLNTRCFAAALESFPRLIDQLKGQELQPRPQDLAQRSYYARDDKPPLGGVVDWSDSAESIFALVRGLDFGNYPNPLGTARLASGSDAWIIRSALVRDGEGAPGLVLSIEEGELEVATGEGSLAVTALTTLEGEEIAISEVVQRAGWNAGDTLWIPDQAARTALEALSRRTATSEAFWRNRLGTLNGMSAEALNAAAASGDHGVRTLARPATGATDPVADAVGAFVLLLSRLAGTDTVDLFVNWQPVSDGIDGVLTSPFGILRGVTDDDQTLGNVSSLIREELDTVSQRGTWLRDLVARQPALQSLAKSGDAAPVPAGVVLRQEAGDAVPPAGAILSLVASADGHHQLIHDRGAINDADIERLLDRYQRILQGFTDTPETRLADVALLSDDETNRVLRQWNDTGRDYDRRCIHELFAAQAARTPDATALVFEGRSLSYGDLDRHANRLGWLLADKGVQADKPVGVYVERSLDLMVATLGTMKAGGAYVPLDPDFPEDRIRYMIDDAGLDVIVTQSHLADRLQDTGAALVVLDDPGVQEAPLRDTPPSTTVDPANLAYIIYTSGSTGKPKGVMVEHRNVANFFAGMDDRIRHDPPGTWLAVTSLSFDISVLELFWTLARGFKVVIYRDRDRHGDGSAAVASAMANRPMEFGLFMWGNDDGPGREKYRLMMEGARFFDENGFHSVWTPERHFHAFGGPYPNPAVTGAALAAITRNLSIRSGSCVSPLHHPIRIAEDWAVIDNLCNGRAGLSFASGWQPNDFVIRPENHKDNKSIMLEQIETVRKLWRGEKVAFENPMGEMVEIATLPRPVQKELPVWVTTAGNPETYKQAGALGANILTHLLGQTVDELAEKIRLYRAARAEAGHDPAAGKVTLMLHTFVGEDTDVVRELVRQPMKDYLQSAMKLVIDFAWSFPAFKRPGGQDSKPEDIDIKSLSAEETDTILDFAFERYFENSGLFGTPEKCNEMVNRCKGADINEIACLLDYGVATDAILDSLPHLKRVRDLANPERGAGDAFSFADQVSDNAVTHLQCTPSMARMLALNEENREALGAIDHLMIGGEALPQHLARELVAVKKGSLSNMYGPTETTIWSTTHDIESVAGDIPIGRPIANTRIYILDRHQRPTPPGIAGELFIGGEGVVRGYLNRPELTAERFQPDPFSDNAGDRLYWTGDLARYREDGTIEFLGRIDHQVKIRGYRIELGEIEAVLDQQPSIRESVVVLREDTPGDQRLAAYLVAEGSPAEAAALKSLLRQSLPDYMVPADFVFLDQLPLTPNRKVDRNALPAPRDVQRETAREYVAPESDLEATIVGIWQETLKVDRVGIDDNFFDLGGHSLLIVRLHGEIRKVVERPVSLTDLYRFPTIRSLVNHLESDDSSAALKKSSDRAERRRKMTRQRRRRA